MLKSADDEVAGVQFKPKRDGGAVNVHLPKGTVHVVGKKVMRNKYLQIIEAFTDPVS